MRGPRALVGGQRGQDGQGLADGDAGDELLVEVDPPVRGALGCPGPQHGGVDRLPPASHGGQQVRVMVAGGPDRAHHHLPGRVVDWSLSGLRQRVPHHHLAPGQHGIQRRKRGRQDEPDIGRRLLQHLEQDVLPRIPGVVEPDQDDLDLPAERPDIGLGHHVPGGGGVQVLHLGAERGPVPLVQIQGGVPAPGAKQQQGRRQVGERRGHAASRSIQTSYSAGSQ